MASSPQGAGRHAGPAPEGPGEVGGVGVTQLDADVDELDRGIFDQTQGSFSTGLFHQLRESQPGVRKVPLKSPHRGTGEARTEVDAGASVGEIGAQALTKRAGKLSARLLPPSLARGSAGLRHRGDRPRDRQEQKASRKLDRRATAARNSGVGQRTRALPAELPASTQPHRLGLPRPAYNRALDAGVRSFEHGFLVSEDVVKRMAAKGQEIAWSFQCFMSVNTFGNYEAMPDFFTHEQKLKGVAVGKGARNAAKMMKEHGVFIVGGSDMFSVPFKNMIKQDITCNVDAGFTPAEALKHWTGNAGIVLKWSGPLDPYPSYALGTIQPDSYADLLLWDANPLENIKVILDEDNLALIMKDGTIYKDEM